MAYNIFNSAFPMPAECNCDILDKKSSQLNYVLNMLNRTNMMFEYDGLPDTIPPEMLELFLQMNGHVCIYKHTNGELYALCGAPGGAPDPYYRPTLYVVANPALNIGKSLVIANHLPAHHQEPNLEKCVMIKSDTNYRGLLPIFARYATQMVENDISIRSAQINARAQVFIKANTDAQAASAKNYVEGLIAGKLEVVADQAFIEGIESENISTQSANTIIQLIELQQYLKASWFNEIGLNANFNMKREYLSEEEVKSSTDLLLPLVDNMLECRKQAFDVVNSMFGTNISVRKNSAWVLKEQEAMSDPDSESKPETPDKGGESS